MPPDAAGDAGSLPDRIDAVTLDAGGVLALPPVDVALDAHGLSFDLDRILLAHHAAVAVEDGLLGRRSEVVDGLGEERQAYYAAFTRRLGIADELVEPLVESLHDLARQEVPWHLVAPGARELVPALNDLGVPVAIVSNSNGTVAAQLELMGICQIGPGPFGQVVAVVDSADVGVRKPDPAIFDHVFAALATDRAHTVHVGDTVSFDVVAARAAGMPVVHYDASATCTGAHAHVASLDGLVALVGSRHHRAT